MFKILVTCRDIAPDELFEWMIKALHIEKERDGEVEVDDVTKAICFCPSQSEIKYDGTEGNNKLRFIADESSDEKHIALNYGKFITFILSNSLWLDKDGEIVKGRQPSAEKGDTIFRFTDYIEAVWIK